MSSLAAVIIGIFVCLVLISFAFQLYVAALLYRSLFGVLFGFMRGTRVFVQGWKRADELKIKDIMQIWTGVIGLMLLMLCPIVVVAAQYEPSSSNRVANNSPRSFSTPRPQYTATFRPRHWEITSPEAGQVIQRGASLDTIPILGSIDYDMRDVATYDLYIGLSSGFSWASFGDRGYARQPEPDSVLGYMYPFTYDPGDYIISIVFNLQSGEATHPRNDPSRWIRIKIID